MAIAPKMTYEHLECLGGPCDGELVAVSRGAAVFVVRIGMVWHEYVLRPTDCGSMLVYGGATECLKAAG